MNRFVTDFLNESLGLWGSIFHASNPTEANSHGG